jgi:hypothetical protein
MIEYDKELNKFHREYYQRRFTEYFDNGYEIWHLTLTWKNPSRGQVSPKILKDRFHHWWLKNLIPHIYQARKFTTKTRLEQPYCVAFVECGKETSIEDVKSLYNPITDEFKPSKLYKNLHHHVLIATKGRATQRLMELTGKNTLEEPLLNDKKYSNRHNRPQDNMTQLIKESCLVRVESINQIKYPHKQLWLWNINSVYEFEPTPKPKKRLLQIRLNGGAVVTASHKQYVSYQEHSNESNWINTVYKPQDSVPASSPMS